MFPSRESPLPGVISSQVRFPQSWWFAFDSRGLSHGHEATVYQQIDSCEEDAALEAPMGSSGRRATKARLWPT